MRLAPMENMMGAAADAFDLGHVHAMDRVEGGLSNDMWRVTASNGEFAVKLMRAHVDAPGFCDNIESAFGIEMNAFRAGILCPEPVPTGTGTALLRADDALLRVHRWCEGGVPVAEHHLEDAGELLANIHRAGRHRVRSIDDHPHGPETWAALAAQPGLPPPLSDQLRSAAPELAHLEMATAASPHLVATFADSHGDLDPKNTLVASGRLLAVDWDAAGPRPIAREAVTLALDWAEDIDGFQRVIAAYSAASGTSVPTDAWVFGGWVAALGDWLRFNVEERADTDLGQREASRACSRLLALCRDLDAHLAALAAK